MWYNSKHISFHIGLATANSVVVANPFLLRSAVGRAIKYGLHTEDVSVGKPYFIDTGQHRITPVSFCVYQEGHIQGHHTECVTGDSVNLRVGGSYFCFAKKNMLYYFPKM